MASKSKIGHNSGVNKSGGIAAEQLQQYVQKVERLESEKADIATDIREVYAEAKANGFDPKTLREIVKIRKKTEAEREEHFVLLDIYARALGFSILT